MQPRTGGAFLIARVREDVRTFLIPPQAPSSAAGLFFACPRPPLSWNFRAVPELLHHVSTCSSPYMNINITTRMTLTSAPPSLSGAFLWRPSRPDAPSPFLAAPLRDVVRFP
jgi:hypothetical protein